MAQRTIEITDEELSRCKRAVRAIVLAEIAKEALGRERAPLEMRLDMKSLILVLLRLEK